VLLFVNTETTGVQKRHAVVQRNALCTSSKNGMDKKQDTQPELLRIARQLRYARKQHLLYRSPIPCEVAWKHCPFRFS
jgi:hypothetical protein